MGGTDLLKKTPSSHTVTYVLLLILLCDIAQLRRVGRNCSLTKNLSSHMVVCVLLL